MDPEPVDLFRRLRDDVVFLAEASLWDARRSAALSAAGGRDDSSLARSGVGLGTVNILPFSLNVAVRLRGWS